jgi:ferredoxin
MADKNSKLATNVPGMYYVDSSCIGCGQCADIASVCFKMGADGLACVYNQPKAAGEKELCAEAKDVCPVEAIGDDGE